MKGKLILLLAIFYTSLAFAQAPNQALHFDGVDDYISFSQSPDLANSSFTIQFWAKKEIGSGAGWALSTGSNGATNEFLHIGWTSNTNFICAFFGNDLSVTVADDGLWHHYAVVYDNSISGADNRFIYQDGIEIASNESLSDFIGSASLNIGRAGAQYFKGAIDQLSIDISAFAPFDITAPIDCQSPISDISYRFIQDDGINLKDYSDFYDGVLQNFALSGNTSNYTDDVPFEIAHFAVPMEDIVVEMGNDLVLNSNFVLADCNIPNVGPYYSYKWYKDGVVIPGQESSILTISDMSAEDQGGYILEVLQFSLGSNLFYSNSSNVVLPPFSASDSKSDYYIDVSWNLAIDPCLLDTASNQYDQVTVQILRDGSQIDFQIFDEEQMNDLYTSNQPIIGNYRDFVGPDQTHDYTLNVFVGPFGNIDTDCFGLTATGSTIPIQVPIFTTSESYDQVGIEINSTSDLATSFEIYRDDQLIQTYTDIISDTILSFIDQYEFNSASSINSGQSYNYEVKMVSSHINQINNYNIGNLATIDMEPNAVGAPTNTEKIDLSWSAVASGIFDKVEIWREGTRFAVKQAGAIAHTDFVPYFGDTTDYQFRFFINDTIRADFHEQAYLPGNGSLSGRVVTQLGQFPVDGVDVSVTRKSTNEEVATTTTNSSGQFNFAGLSYGLLDSFEVEATLAGHTFTYPVQSYGLSSSIKDIDNVLILDDFTYTEGASAHTINSFTAIPEIDSDLTTLSWNLSTTASEFFIDIIRNGEIIFSSTNTADLIKTLDDLDGTPDEETSYELRIYDINGNTVSSSEEQVEVIFPEVAAIPDAQFTAVEEEINGAKTGNVLLTFSHSSSNFDNYRIYRNDSLITELPNDATQYVDDSAPFSSSLGIVELIYSITATRVLNNTTYETEIPTEADPINRINLPGPLQVAVYPQANTPSVLINWLVLNGSSELEYTGFLIYRNDELIATKYKGSNVIFDTGGAGMIGAVYSVSLFKQTTSGVIESDKAYSPPIDFPLAIVVPDLEANVVVDNIADYVVLTWSFNNTPSSNISGYILTYNDDEIARLPAHDVGFIHYPSSGSNHEYKIYVYNTRNEIDHISTEFESATVSYNLQTGLVYPPQNFVATQNLENHVKLCWEYLDFIQSEFVISKFGSVIDTLPVGSRSYYDYTPASTSLGSNYTIQAIQGGQVSTIVGDLGKNVTQRLIYGIVKDDTGEGIPNTAIELNYSLPYGSTRNVLHTYTDSSGYYSFLTEGLEDGLTYGIRAKHNINNNSNSPSHTFTANSADEIEVNFILDIPNRPEVLGLAELEYMNVDINQYTLHGNVHWRTSNSNYDGVEIYRGMDLIGSVAKEDGSVYMDTTAIPGIEYPYLFRTYIETPNGIEYSAMFERVTTYPPVAPVVNLTATPQVSSNSVLIQWSHIFEHADGYIVSVNGTPTYNVEADTFFRAYDTEGIAGQEYTYKVNAYKLIDGQALLSSDEIVSAIFPAVAPVSNLQLSAPTEIIDGSTVNKNYTLISWDYEAGDVESFKIWRDSNLIATLPADSLSYRDYEYPVWNNNEYTMTAVINQQGVISESVETSESFYGRPITAPVNFTAVPDTEEGVVHLSWQYNYQGIDRFTIYAVDQATNSWRVIDYDGELYLDGIGTHNLVDNDGIPGQIVDYWVSGADERDGILYSAANINQALSAIIEGVTIPNLPAPIAEASDDTFDRAIEVNWTYPSTVSIDGFQLTRDGVIIDTLGIESRQYLDQFSIDETDNDYTYKVTPCKIINDVMTCYDDSSAEDEGSFNLPSINNKTSSIGSIDFDVSGEWKIVAVTEKAVNFYKWEEDKWILNQDPTTLSLPTTSLFINSVAIYDNPDIPGDEIAVIGVPNHTNGQNGNKVGKVFVYKINSNGEWGFFKSWLGEANVTPGLEDIQLGVSVDVEGDYIAAVGAIGAGEAANGFLDNTFDVYKITSTGVTEVGPGGSPPGGIDRKLATSGDRTVAIRGGQLFIGYPNAYTDNIVANNKGLAVVYQLTSSAVTFQQHLVSDLVGVTQFGWGVDAANEDKVAISTKTANNFGNGLVSVYEKNSSSVFVENTAWRKTFTDPTIGNNFFGNKVRYLEDQLLVSSDNPPGVFGLEKLFLFRHTANDLTLIQSGDPNSSSTYRPEFYNNNYYNNDFGIHIALSPDQVFAAEPPVDEDEGGNVYFFKIYNPEITSVTASDGTFNFTRIDWTSVCDDCPSEYIDNYEIYRDGEHIATVNGTETQFFDDPANILTSASAAIPGQVYIYEVLAKYGYIDHRSTKLSDSGYSERKGRISGDVYVDGTNSGVEGVMVEIHGVDTVGTPYSYSTLSQLDGSFIIDEIFVSELPIKYTITASSATGEFVVSGSDFRLLSVANSLESNIIIFDQTTFVIQGHATNVATDCGIEGIYVSYFQIVNGVESLVDSSATDQDGLYSIIVKPNLPGLQQIKIEIADKVIITDDQSNETSITQYDFLTSQQVYSDFSNFPMITELDFTESLSYPVTVNIQNACSLPVADQQINISVSSLDGCFQGTYATDASGIITLDLPPKNYLFTVESLVGAGITPYENAAIDYLKNRQFNFDLYSIHESIGDADTVLILDPIVFEYHRAPLFALSTSFDRYLCDDPMEASIITQGDAHSIDLSVTETHQGQTCGVLGGYIVIQNPAAITATDTLINEDGTFPTYNFIAGGPNLISPYAYGITMQYFSDEGNFLGQRIISTIVEGQRQLPGTGIITESGEDEAGNLLLPLFVLRDPPGDGSSSSIASGTTISSSLEIDAEKSGGGGFYLESAVTIFGFGAFADLNTGGGGGSGSAGSFDISVTTEQAYSTSDSEDAVGRGANVIVGTGLSQQYGIARSLYFEDDCTPINETELTFGTGGFQSTYSYTVDFIEGLIEKYIQDSILIEAGTLKYVKPDGSNYTKDQARVRAHALITAWKEMIHYHDVETVPHYVLCNDFSYRDDLDNEHESAYDGWRNGFCTLIGTYQGDQFVMDDEIDWTPNLINAYNNTIAFTDRIKDPLSSLVDGNLLFSENEFESNQLSVTNSYHNLLGNQAKSAEVFDISGNVNFEKTITAQQSSATTKSFSRFFFFDFAGGGFAGEEAYAGVGFMKNITEYDIKVGASITSEASINISRTQAEENVSTISYNIFDDDAEDQVTFIALQAPLQNQTPYFIRLGGLSSCPQEEELTVGQDNAPLWIDDFDINVAIIPGGAVSDVAQEHYVDPEGTAIFEIKLSSEGPTGLTRDAQVFLDLATNPFGAILKIGGSDLNIVEPIYSISPGSSQTLFLSVERPQNTPFYDFEGLKIGVRPACGGDAEYIDLDVFFQSPCSDISLTMPTNDYVVNRINSNIEDDQEVIPFEIRDYDSSIPILSNVKLQYKRLGGNAAWTQVPSGIFTRQVLEDSDNMNAAGVDPLYFFEWDITGLYSLIPDGDYLVRALTSCTDNGGTNYSNEVSVKIARSPLLLVGYSEPADGVWTSGDEISSTFSSDIDCNLLNAVNNIEDYLTLTDLTTMMDVPFEFSCQNDKITISPTQDMATYDGHTLRVTYDGILSLEENIAEKIIWDFNVITQDVYWTDDMIEVTVYQGNTETVSTSIFNASGFIANNISILGADNLDWLTINPTTALSIPIAGQSVDLQFDGDVAVGDYMTTLYLNEIADTLPHVNVLFHVIETPPFPEVNGEFTDSMEMVLNWSFVTPYSTSTDIEDAIYIYKDGQLRGSGMITAEGDLYYTKITVYGNAEDEGDILDFAVWNANQNVAYSAVESTLIPFNTGAKRGKVHNPEIILVDNDLFEIGKRIYVDHTIAGTQNGFTWTTAFSDLQDAIDVANDGDEIWMAQGTYYPTSGADRSVSYVFDKQIILYAGFINGMSDIADRTGANETILSGNLGQANNLLDNSYHVVESSSSNLVLDMLTIADGNADGAADDNTGGCLYNIGAISLKNCNMKNGNASIKGGLLYNSGQMIIDGGVYTIPAVSTISNLYNDTGALITIRQSVSIEKE